MSREQVLDEVRDGQRFVLVTHENPDGDALGSLVGMHNVLRALGKDSVMFMSADEFPLPYEYRFFDLDGLASVPPPDIDARTVIYLDCGNIDRNPLDIVKRVQASLPDIRAAAPTGLELKELFDQSLFVRAAVRGVVTEGAIAACLTGLMILL